MIIAGGEYFHCSMKKLIIVIDELVKEYLRRMPFKIAHTDLGSEFGASRI
jgi:putative transposase